MPVFEGFGNHDFPYATMRTGAGGAESLNKVVSTKITLRSDHPSSANDRASLFASGDFNAQNEDRGGYFWDWQDIRFFNLNVKPSGGGEANNVGLQCSQLPTRLIATIRARSPTTMP